MYTRMLILLTSIFCLFVTSCRSIKKNEVLHSCQNFNDTLFIRFHGAADAVRFKMFEGLDFMLRKGSGGYFEGSFASKDLDDAVFSYDIIAYSLDSAKNYVDLDYRNNSNGDNFFIHNGKNLLKKQNPTQSAEKSCQVLVKSCGVLVMS